MQIDKLSPSAYDAYSFCQFKYFLSNVLYIEDVSGPSAELGHVAHAVLERIGKLKIDQKELTETVAQLWDEEANGLDLGKDASKIQKIKTDLINFVSESKYNPYKCPIITVEKYFRIPIEIDGESFKITGLIDRIDKINDSTIEIIDYKTGRRQTFMSNEKDKKDSIDMYEDIQPRMYYYAAKELYSDIENIIVTMIYLGDGGPFTIPFDHSSTEVTKQLLKKRYVEIKENINPERNQGWWCSKMCSYGKSGKCEKIYNDLQENGMQFCELLYGNKKQNKSTKQKK